MDIGKLFSVIANDSTALGAAALVACALAILLGFLFVQIQRRRAHTQERETVVPLVVFAPRAGSGDSAAPHARPIPRPIPRPVPQPIPRPEQEFAPPVPVDGEPPAYFATGNGNGRSTPPQSAPAAEDRSHLIEGKTVRFYRPPEGTLQMLPGRLEIVDGEDRGQAIRFVKTRPGTQQITFGRREGTPYEHIQLRAPTVSRQHARLDFEHGHWNIANLSETNPVQINGEALFPGHGTRPLEDGDRIEMGEVVFRFKER